MWSLDVAVNCIDRSVLSGPDAFATTEVVPVAMVKLAFCGVILGDAL